MVKAHSLLYALYVCLIMAILCSALLYTATLYNRLNIYYSAMEEMYVQNRSAANYAVALLKFGDVQYDNEIVNCTYSSTGYGMFKIISVSSYAGNDTVSSAYFAGQYPANNMCLYLTDYDNGLTYSGSVALIGDKKLPSSDIAPKFINNRENTLTATGTISKSSNQIPVISTTVDKIYEDGAQLQKVPLHSLEKQNDSLYFNSFLSQTRHVNVANTLENIIIKGNFILYSADSILIKKTAKLEDVILKAPSISFEKGFRGTVQVFCTKSIHVDEDVVLKYPSIVVVNNKSKDAGGIVIKDNVKISGAVLLTGILPSAISDNMITLCKGSIITGEVYCQGRLNLMGSVYGTVYTNKFLYTSQTSKYENHLYDAEINVTKRPAYFVSAVLFDDKSYNYGLLKKIL